LEQISPIAPKYIYILSDKRSGSTVLENLLAQMDGVFSAGELRLLQGHYLKEGAGKDWNWQCTCGESIQDCTIWSKVSTLLAEKPTLIAHPAVNQLLGRSKKLNWLDSLPNVQPSREEIANSCRQMLELAAPAASHWVDSSKDPIQAFFMAKAIPNARILIIERSLRAIAYSKYKHKKRKEEPASIWKLLIEVFRNAQLRQKVKEELTLLNLDVQVLQYEVFIQSPAQFVAQVLDRKLAKDEIERLHYFDASQQHSIAGTPSRFEKKRLRLDESWKGFYSKRPMVNLLGSWLERRI